LRQQLRMETTQASARYSRGAIALHWLIAVLIIANVLEAWLSDGAPKPQRIAVMSVHEASGILILLLSFARFAWRLMYKPPAMVETLKAWEAALARVTHWLFYFLMIALPLTGWAMASAFGKGKPVSMFGLFDMPALPVGYDKPTAEMFETMHGVLGNFILVGLLALHVVGALKHQFVDHDGTLRRMVPFLR